MAGLEIDRVVKRFGNVEVIHGVSIRIEDGEFVVLVGPSGCGKSTLLRMIAGLDTISSGIVRIGGRVVNNVAPKDRDIAMVFQNYALYPHMTVARNMSFALELAHAPKSEIAAKVAKAAEILGLQPLLERLPRQLSGGQRQRVAMGRAIVRDPARLSVRRAAVQSRRQTARPDAGGDQTLAAAAVGDDRLCHARPDRGDDDG